MPAAGITYHIEVDPAALGPDLDPVPLLEALADFSPVIEQWAEIMSAAQRRNWQQRGAPFGEEWAPLSPRTVKEKERHGWPGLPLVRTGALERSIGTVLAATDTTAVVGIPLNDFEKPYPAYLDAGSAERHLPARILIGFDLDELADLQSALEGYLYEHGFPPGSIKIEVTASGASLTAA